MSCEEHARKREKARELRRQGLSIAEIGRAIEMNPRSRSLRRWVADIVLAEPIRRGKPPNIQETMKAVEMRKLGHTYKEISQALDVSRSSCSLWLRDVPISEEHRRSWENRTPPGGSVPRSPSGVVESSAKRKRETRRGRKSGP